MKMIMAVISKKSGDKVLEALVSAGYMATFNETRGGMLRQSQLTIYLGLEDEDVAPALRIIKENCKLRTSLHKAGHPGEDSQPTPELGTFQLGSAVVFIWELEKIEKY